jgi:hypothetical protein
MDKLLALGLWLAVLTVLIAIDHIRMRKMAERLRKLEKERDMWRLAAEHWERAANSW